MALHVNFARIMDPKGWEKYQAEESVKKTQMPEMAFNRIYSYRHADGGIDGITFRHIVMFMNTGERTGRLEVACADHGYTLAELVTLREEGRTSFDIADEIISRGVRPPMQT